MLKLDFLQSLPLLLLDSCLQFSHGGLQARVVLQQPRVLLQSVVPLQLQGGLVSPRVLQTGRQLGQLLLAPLRCFLQSLDVSLELRQFGGIRRRADLTVPWRESVRGDILLVFSDIITPMLLLLAEVK